MDDIYINRINDSIASLFANMEQRISAEDMQRVRAAYALAAEAHQEQRHKTGEPYTSIRLPWPALWPRSWNWAPTP